MSRVIAINAVRRHLFDDLWRSGLSRLQTIRARDRCVERVQRRSACPRLARACMRLRDQATAMFIEIAGCANAAAMPHLRRGSVAHAELSALTLGYELLRRRARDLRCVDGDRACGRCGRTSRAVRGPRRDRRGIPSFVRLLTSSAASTRRSIPNGPRVEGARLLVCATPEAWFDAAAERSADSADRSCQLRKKGRRHGIESCCIATSTNRELLAADVAIGARRAAPLRASAGDDGSLGLEYGPLTPSRYAGAYAQRDSNVRARTPDRYLDRRRGGRGAFV